MHPRPLLDPQAVGKLDLFAELPSSALGEVLESAHIRELTKDTTIFSQGDLAGHCYVVVSGRIRISQSAEDGAQLLVRFVGAGEMFGTAALFAGGTYPAEAVAITDSVILSWSEATVLRLVERYPRIALNIIAVIGARLRDMQDRLREVATQRVHQRIARVLLRLHAQAVQSGAHELAIPLTRQDVAQMCGTTLHTASRVLTEWEKKGLLVTHRQHVTLSQVAEIRRIGYDPDS
jgi:CRP/FNR family transcriptional regulator, nitrogen oxide reductase regulator